MTHQWVNVTFDEEDVKQVHPSILIPCADKKPIVKETFDHPRGIYVGLKVKMISNMEKLVKNQRKAGGWNPSMTQLRRQEAVVVSILKDKSVLVQLKNGRPWRVSADSVLMSEDTEEPSKDLQFLPGDIVKFAYSKNIGNMFLWNEIPQSFIEHLKLTARVESVDDGLDLVLEDDQRQKVAVSSCMLQKCSQPESDDYESNKTKAQSLKPGDTVFLDVGPPNFVHAVLTSINASTDIIKPMTTPSTLLCFINENTVVIESSDGLKYKINKIYLTIPTKIAVDDGLDLTQVQVIQRAIGNAVTKITNSEVDEEVHIVSMKNGNPSKVVFKVTSSNVTQARVIKWLIENKGWKVEELCSGMFTVSDIEGKQRNIHVGLIIRDGDLTYFLEEGSKMPSNSNTMEFLNSSADSVKQPTHERGPVVKNIKQFRYMHLRDRALGRDVYFPYILHGEERKKESIAPEQLSETIQQSVNIYSRSIDIISINSGDILLSERQFNSA